MGGVKMKKIEKVIFDSTSIKELENYVGYEFDVVAELGRVFVVEYNGEEFSIPKDGCKIYAKYKDKSLGEEPIEIIFDNYRLMTLEDENTLIKVYNEVDRDDIEYVY